MKNTINAVKDTCDLIKSAIYSIDLIVQIGYVSYLGYRIYSNTGIFITNIILLVLSLGYLLYHVITTREFYTDEQSLRKKRIKNVVTLSKRLVNATVIGISIYQLAINPNVSNMALLSTFMMILGFTLSIVGDIVYRVVSNKMLLIWNAMKYDFNEYSNEHSILMAKPKSWVGSKIDLDVESKMVKKIKDVSHRQENKERRRLDFFKKNK